MIQLHDIVKRYDTGEDNVVYALRGVSLTIKDGEFVAIIGSSGSGKSTMMNILGCLDPPTTGTYMLDGQEVSSLGDDGEPQKVAVKTGDTNGTQTEVTSDRLHEGSLVITGQLAANSQGGASGKRRAQ